MELLPGAWFVEKTDDAAASLGWKVEGLLHDEQSPYQRIQVWRTSSVGKLLALDGRAMLSERDEFIYHEVLAHVPAMVQRRTSRVLVIGGGDGGVAREYARYPFVESIDLVEIDLRVPAVCQQHFPQFAPVFSDPRLKLHGEDGYAFLEREVTAGQRWDVVIVDCTDPDGPAARLFSPQFYALASKALAPGGVFMCQSENPFLDEYGIRQIYQNLRAAFPIVESLCAPMLVYPGGLWSFAFASHRQRPLDFNHDRVLAQAELVEGLSWYNVDWHRGAFALSNFHKRALGMHPH